MSIAQTASRGIVPVRPRPQRLAGGDHEFLPAALEILETPLSPVGRVMNLTICSFVAAAVAWSCVGRVDIIATAQGKVQPVGRTKVIQPMETGKVLAVLVENGRRVRAGDSLVTLDPGENLADEAGAMASLQSARAEVARRTAALAAASGRSPGTVPAVAFASDAPAAVVGRERRVLVGDLAQLASAVASLNGQAREKAAERERLKGTIDAQRALVATLRERVDMRSQLFQTKTESRAKVIDALETTQGQEATLASETGQLGEIEAALGRIDRDVDKAYGAFSAENAQKLADAERTVDEDGQKLAKAQVRSGHMTLRSPVDGTVTGLTVTSVGQVLTVGEQVMQVVPSDAAVEVEAYLPNADVGFVRTGQVAIVKVDSFPFTDFGTIDASVVRVARDAIPQPDADQREGNPAAASRDGMFGGAQRVQNLVYPITVTLDRTSMRSEGEDVPLLPGMSVSVEVKTGTRRIISYLLGPVLQVATTALHER